MTSHPSPEECPWPWAIGSPSGKRLLMRYGAGVWIILVCVLIVVAWALLLHVLKLG